MHRMFQALQIEADSRPDRRNRMRLDPHYVRVAQIGVGGPRLLHLPVKATKATGGMLEQLVKEQLPRTSSRCRAMLVRQDNSIITQEQMVRFEAEEVIWAVVMEPMGAVLEDTKIPELAKQLMRGLHGRLRLNQVKLLLRGEQGLCGRISKHSELQRQCALVIETAVRYGIPVKQAEEPVSVPAAQRKGDQAWTEVVRKAKQNPQVPPTSSSKPKRSTVSVAPSRSTRRYALKPEQWSQPVLDRFQLSVPGVFLEASLEEAEVHAKQAMAARFPLALVAVQPLPFAKHVEQVALEVQEQEDGKPVRDKLVTAFVSMYGPERVQYHGQASAVIRKSPSITTCVLRARVTPSSVSTKGWKAQKKLTTPMEMRARVRELRPDLVIEDLFRMQVTEEDITYLVRIQAAQRDAWLLAKGLAVTMSPVGTGMNEFKVVWDKNLQLLSDIEGKYSQMAGYCGAVLCQRGLGARFHLQSYQEARTTVGLDPGVVYQISGMDVASSEQDIIDTMQAMQWKVTFIPGSRKVRGKVLHAKVRAEAPPPKTVLRVMHESEITTVYIKEQQQVSQVQQKEPLPLQPVKTWAAAIKATLGPQQKMSTPPPSNTTQEPVRAPAVPTFGSRGEKRPTWAEQMEQPMYEEDEEEESSTEESDQEHLWDLFADLPPWQTEHVDVEADGFVENPKKKARKAVRSKTQTSSKKRLRTLEHGMQVVQQQLAQLVGALQGKAETADHFRGPWRGSIRWPADLTVMPEAITKVPGDGDCLWHALSIAKHGPQAVGQLPMIGKQMKREVLGWMREHQAEVGKLWGCPPSTVGEVAKTWETDWADARALVLAAHLHEVVLLIFNSCDGTIEAFHGGIEPKLEGVFWTLSYDGTHYNMMQPPSIEEVGQLSQVLHMKPWRHDKNRPLAGGYVIRRVALAPGQRRRAILMGKKRKVDMEGMGEGAPKPKEMEVPAHCAMTWNIGGMKTNLEHLRYLLRAYNPSFIALQETRLSAEHQGMCQQVLRKDRYEFLAGQPARWGLGARGRQVLRIGEVPGVALIFRNDLRVSRTDVITEGAKEMYRQGRLLLATVFPPNQGPILLCVYYASTGHQGSKERQIATELLLAEMGQHATDRVILAGDFNEDVATMQLGGLLQCQRGWRLPPLLTWAGDKAPGTFRMHQDSWLDAFLLGSEVGFTVPGQYVLDSEERKHSPVLIQVSDWSQETHPRVCFPPKIRSIHNVLDDNIDWEALQGRLNLLACDPNMEKQECADIMWHHWLEAVRAFTKERVELEEGQSHDRIGRCILAWTPPAQTQVQRDAPHEHMCRHAIDKLYDYHPLDTKKRAWFLDHMGTLCKCLNLDDTEFLEALNTPAQFREDWKARLAHYRQNERSRKVEAWKRSLEVKGSPTPKLYRWLKSQPPTPPIALCTQEGVITGPRKVLEAFRVHWESIMNRDAWERQQVLEWISRSPVSDQPPAEDDIKMLYECLSGIKSGTSPGLDGWPGDIIRILPKKAACVLAGLYGRFEEWAVWPSMLCFVRTHMLAKELNEQHIGTPADWRPIAVTSCWMRLWSKWRLAMMPQELFDNLDSTLTGGLPGRKSHGTMLEFLLTLEREMDSLHPEEAQWFGISVDASKCFDRVSQPKVIEQAMQVGFPLRALRGTMAFLTLLRRRFSCGGYLGQDELLPTNGLLQGDPLSVLLCNIVVNTWTQKLQGPGIRLQGYIDDRTVAANDPELLNQAWNHSLEWDRENSWHTNQKKTCLLAFGKHARQQWEALADHALDLVGQTSLLGQDVVVNPAEVPEKQRVRIDRAIEAAKKIQRLNLRPDVARIVIGATVLPKMTYGLVPKPVPKRLIQLLRTCIKEALSKAHRQHSWDAVCLVANPGHQIDPMA